MGLEQGAEQDGRMNLLIELSRLNRNDGRHQANRRFPSASPLAVLVVGISGAAGTASVDDAAGRSGHDQ